MLTISDPDEVRLVLSDARFTVPAVDGGPRGTLAWLRSHVCRFSSGPEHARRRAVVEAELAHVAVSDRADHVAALAEGLGLTPAAAEGVVGDVRRVAAAYQPVLMEDDDPYVARSTSAPAVAGDSTGEEDCDSSVARLVAALAVAGREDDDELTAARICLLVQSSGPVAELRERPDALVGGPPPVAATRRVAAENVTLAGRFVPAGTVLRVELDTLPFGAGEHACPGRDQALALASGRSVRRTSL